MKKNNCRLKLLNWKVKILKFNQIICHSKHKLNNKKLSKININNKIKKF